MWYLVVGALLGIWTFIDGTRRKLGGAKALIYSASVLILWPLALSVYGARKPLKENETREGGTAWNVLRSIIFWWTILWILATLSVTVGVGEAFGELETGGQILSGTIGAGLGYGLFCAIWIVPTIVMLVLGFAIKSNTVVHGPTGPLAAEFPSGKPAPKKKKQPSNVRMQTVRELIEEGHYDEARSILRTMEHPQAQEWLDRIDELDASE